MSDSSTNTNLTTTQVSQIGSRVSSPVRNSRCSRWLSEGGVDGMRRFYWSPARLAGTGAALPAHRRTCFIVSLAETPPTARRECLQLAHQPETDVVVTAVGDQGAGAALRAPAGPGGGASRAAVAAVGAPFRYLPVTCRGRQARTFGCGREPVALDKAAAAPPRVVLGLL